MSETHEKDSVELGGCPLSPANQTRNLLIFGACISLTYLMAPVGYVGVTHAGLLNFLGYNDRVANLPGSVYLYTAPIPVLVAWYFPFVRMLKTLLVTSYLVTAFASALVAAALLTGSPELVLASVLVNAGLLGITAGVVAMVQWEALARGVSESRRGRALALAYGAGPILACVGSLGSQLLLKGDLYGWIRMDRLAYPWDYLALFGPSVAIAALAALSATRWIIPLPAVEVARKPFAEEMVFGLRSFFSYWPILFAALAYILTYAGSSAIMQNVSLYTRDAIGVDPKDYSGTQNALRFGVKAVAGFILGWLIAKFHPKAGLVFTTALGLAGVLWALFVPGKWYLLSFGVLGAGELMGAYYTYYILCCSAKSRARRNLAYTSLITVPVGFAGNLYGEISDHVGARYGSAVGLKTSFCLAGVFLVIALILVIRVLPARPVPRLSDTDDSDRALGEEKR